MLLVAASLHAGFQLVVTLVVYPALVAVPPGSWEPAHDAHSRRIAVLVVPLYLLVLAACAAALVEIEAGDIATVLAVSGQLAAVLITATLAAPTHGALGRRGPEPGLLRRLLLVDRLRCAAVVLGLLGALLAAS